MQAPEKAGAATQRYAGGDPKFERLGGVLGTKNSGTLQGRQPLDETNEEVPLDTRCLRIQLLRSRFGLDASMAALVADLAFSNSRRRY